uniref:Uncharacterized protein n=1 Tax=Paramoeba aestuarina TaxID=180227 RepID=A0A7S4KDZ9_9EUKA
MGVGVFFGSCFGIALTCIANGARHVNIVKNPWEHAAFAVLFGTAGYYHDKYLPILTKANIEREKAEGTYDERQKIPFVRPLYLEDHDGSDADPTPPTRGPSAI